LEITPIKIVHPDLEKLSTRKKQKTQSKNFTNKGEKIEIHGIYTPNP